MPKWQRIASLIIQHNKQSLTRIRYDWGRELVVIASTGILLGLFYYMFRDFLQDKLNDLPTSLRELIATRLRAVVMLGLGLWVGGRLSNLYRDEPGWAHFALRSGEDPQVVRAFRLGQSLLLIAVSYGIFGYFFQPELSLQIGSLALAGATFAFMRYRKESTGPQNLKPILRDAPESRADTLRNWRWFQIVQRNRLCRLCLVISLILQLSIAVMHGLGWPLFLTVLATMMASALLAWALAFQLEDDMRAIWFERQLGCSHEEFVKVYEHISWRLGLGLALLSLVSILVTGVPGRVPLGEWIKLLPIAALFPLITPAIMFQVAPERPLLQILITSLIGLFLGTAIYAHILSIVLVPIAITYAKNYQKDNFYRS
ncbi:hypothetical protein [Oligoflexus tunisiensis]|uniref:hypothetical protein n=1 Tax=Oligoflexus tunisiensis TaxID=708132 RepID=UPI00114D3519|nr:hypothetical protein [Oligoflexus tunisiensis]